MGCSNCGPTTASTRYELTLADGTSRIYLTEVEARIAASAAGGGTIRPIS